METSPSVGKRRRFLQFSCGTSGTPVVVSKVSSLSHESISAGSMPWPCPSESHLLHARPTWDASCAHSLQEARDSASQRIAGRSREFTMSHHYRSGGTFRVKSLRSISSLPIRPAAPHSGARSRSIRTCPSTNAQNMRFNGRGSGNARAVGQTIRRAQLCRPSVRGRRALADLGRMVARAARTRNVAAVAALDAATRCVRRDRRKLLYFARMRSPPDSAFKETNDFIYSPLHVALRKQRSCRPRTCPATRPAFSFADLLDHPAVRYPDPGEPPVDAKRAFRDWLGLPASDTTSLTDLQRSFQAGGARLRSSRRHCRASFFLPDQYSNSAPCSWPDHGAARLASSEADGCRTRCPGTRESAS